MRIPDWLRVSFPGEKVWGSFGFSEYPQGKRKKIILKEEKERAVKELISGNDVSNGID